MKEIIVKVLLKWTHFTKPHCESIADEIVKELTKEFCWVREEGHNE